jgi:large subunit ribosomal protein L7/L12
MSDLNAVVDQLSKLTVLEVSELVKELEEKWGVSAAAAVAQAPASVAGGSDASAEKTSFNVVLKDFGSSKINVIKEVRAVTGLGLKEAKELVEAGGEIKKDIKKEEAEEIKKGLEAAGATVEIS